QPGWGQMHDLGVAHIRPPLSTLTPQARSHVHANALLASATRPENKSRPATCLGRGRKAPALRGGLLNAHRRGNCLPATSASGEHRTESIIANKDGDRNGFRFAGLIIGPRVRTATTERSDQARRQKSKASDPRSFQRFGFAQSTRRGRSFLGRAQTTSGTVAKPRVHCSATF